MRSTGSPNRRIGWIRVLMAAHNNWYPQLPTDLPPRLEKFVADHCNFSSTIPFSWAEHRALSVVLLNNNTVKGPLPPLLNLNTLDLAYNQINYDFIGFVSTFIRTDSSRIQDLRLSHNNLHGPMYADLFVTPLSDLFRNMRHLDISHNPSTPAIDSTQRACQRTNGRSVAIAIRSECGVIVGRSPPRESGLGQRARRAGDGSGGHGPCPDAAPRPTSRR